MEPIKIIQLYYISSGKKNAMYTLRCRRQGGAASVYYPDYYVCNLSTDGEIAEEKASAYVDAIRERVTESEAFRIVFAGGADFPLFERRHRMSARDTKLMTMIEEGVFPIGKHVGTRFDEAPMNYVLWFADKVSEDNDLIISAIANACSGVALEKGYIATREKQREEIAKQRALSNYIGEVGQRLEFKGKIVLSKECEGAYGTYYVNKVLCGNDYVTYIGNIQFGEKGEEIEFHATIKKHEEFEGTKSTMVNRPKFKWRIVMGKYVKKPIPVDAFQWDPNSPASSAPNWYVIECCNGNLWPEFDGTLHIKTLEGTMIAKPGDWIIKGVVGEIYPCRADIFEMTYMDESVRDDAAQLTKAEPVAYVDGDDSLRRILWEPDQAAFNLPVGTKLYPAPQPSAEAVRDAALEEAANTATGFLVGDPLAGIPLRNPMTHEIADAIRALKSAPPQPAEHIEADDTCVICPGCAHQFRAIPVQVQSLMLAAGFEPPFTDAPKEPK